MKRVVAFSDMFEEIPTSAKYLFSRKAELFMAPKDNLAIETEGGILNIAKEKIEKEVGETINVLYMHYYEVDSMDFEELVEAGFLKKNGSEKMKEFMHKYKLSTK